MTQPGLFDSPAPDLQKEIEAELRKPFSRYAPADVCSSRHRGADTSEEAYDVLRASVSATREKVYQFIRRAGSHGCTTDEIARAFGWTPNQVSPRVSELLYRECRVIKNGLRRETRSGSAAAVVVAAEFSVKESHSA